MIYRYIGVISLPYTNKLLVYTFDGHSRWGVPFDGFVYTSIYEYILYIRRIPYIPYIRAAYILHCSTLRLHTLKILLLKFGMEPTLRGAGLAWGAQVRAF